MNKYVQVCALGLALAFLLGGMASGAVVRVHPGDSIQVAIDEADPGDTIEVNDGVYNEAVELTKNLTLRGVGMPTIKAWWDTAVTISADGCTVEGFRLKGSDVGVHVSSDSNIVEMNVIEDCKTAGIVIYQSDENGIQGNIIRGGVDGIFISDSAGNVIAANDICTGWSWWGAGIYLNNSNGNMVIANTAEIPLLGIGIDVDFSKANFIMNNTARGGRIFGSGILVFECRNITVSRNVAIGRSILACSAIDVMKSRNIIIKGNNASASGDRSNCIQIATSDDNLVIGNRVDGGMNGKVDGIFLTGSDNNRVMGNRVTNNSDRGIDLLWSSDNNTITGNLIQQNANALFVDGFDNAVYLNSFIGNIKGVGLWTNSTKWCSPSSISYRYRDRSYSTMLGNYWSDYNGTDEGGDGIGDRPHLFEGGVDANPLVEPHEEYEIEGI